MLPHQARPHPAVGIFSAPRARRAFPRHARSRQAHRECFPISTPVCAQHAGLRAVTAFARGAIVPRAERRPFEMKTSSVCRSFPRAAFRRAFSKTNASDAPARPVRPSSLPFREKKPFSLPDSEKKSWKTKKFAKSPLFPLAKAGPFLYKVFRRAEVAQLVEQGTENPRVGSSILSLGTIFF